MQINNITTVTLKTDFGNYATIEAFPQETLNELVLRFHETCGSSITLQNFRSNGKNVHNSERIIELFRKVKRSNSSPKISSKKLCRLCAHSSKNLMDIFSPTSDYSEMIRTCLSIEVNENDKLPIKICKTCSGILTEFYKFKQKTTEAELKLKSYFKCSDTLTSSFRNASVILDSNELFQTSDADYYMTEDLSNFEDASDSLFSFSESNRNTDDIVQDDEEFSEDEEKCLPCKWCSKSFDTVLDLYNHSLCHSNNTSTVNRVKTNSMRKGTKRIRRIQRRQTCYLCMICDQVFPVKPLLLQHCNALHRTSGKNVLCGGVVQLSRVFSCNKCDVKYLRLKQLVQHIQNCNPLDTSNTEMQSDRRKLWCIPLLKAIKYVCKYCNNSFPSSRCLTKHTYGNDIQGLDKIFSCKECPRSFISDCALNWHMKSHTETKEYICEMCGKTYSKLAALQKHRVKHSFDKPFICITCNKSFKTKESIKAHERVHTGERPYTCPDCSIRFKTTGALAKHKKIHLDIRAFGCPVCPSTFKTSYSQKVHMLIHTGQKPHKCQHCDATFRYRKDMIKHMQDSH